jgi:predicted DCC family thiol-disulfide oxidoreductase YuxK
MAKHLILFDGECAFCHQAVRRLIALDEKGLFVFAPLGGEAAKRILTGPQEKLKRADSLVLVEDYESTGRRFWIRSRAIFRFYWLLGDGWGSIGWLSFLPGWTGDFLYRRIAAHRHQFKIQPHKDLGPRDRFLP